MKKFTFFFFRFTSAIALATGLFAATIDLSAQQEKSAANAHIVRQHGFHYTSTIDSMLKAWRAGKTLDRNLLAMAGRWEISIAALQNAGIARPEHFPPLILRYYAEHGRGDLASAPWWLLYGRAKEAGLDLFADNLAGRTLEFASD